MSTELLVDAAIAGAAMGLGAEIGLILAVFAIDFSSRIKDDVTRRRRAVLWATIYPRHVRHHFAPDTVPMLKATAGFIVGGAALAVALVLMAVGLLEVV